jgi:hypothetical protein
MNEEQERERGRERERERMEGCGKKIKEECPLIDRGSALPEQGRTSGQDRLKAQILKNVFVFSSGKSVDLRFLTAVAMKTTVSRHVAPAERRASVVRTTPTILKRTYTKDFGKKRAAKLYANSHLLAVS